MEFVTEYSENQFWVKELAKISQEFFGKLGY